MEEEPPLVDCPTEYVPEEEVIDLDVPLADVPRTGDNSLIWVITAALSSVGLAILAIIGKKKSDEV